jgi:hypothetical protein
MQAAQRCAHRWVVIADPSGTIGFGQRPGGTGRLPQYRFCPFFKAAKVSRKGSGTPWTQLADSEPATWLRKSDAKRKYTIPGGNANGLGVRQEDSEA